MNRYSATLEYLYGLEKSGIVFGLDSIKRILELLGNPQDTLTTVHVGGTNGKGSVARMVSAVLQQSGYRVGCYTSPHLVSFTERIAIGGVQITEPETVELTEFIRSRIEASGAPVRCTFFDFTTAMAFEYFRRNSVDAAVIEVGLGGRLDSTNVITPLVTVITNVEMDHTEYLGTSLKEIAAEKAGIIKPGVPVVTGARGAALDVLRAKAGAESPLYVLGEAFSYEKTAEQVMRYEGIEGSRSDLHLNLAGDHQLSNCALALCTLELLARRGFAASEETVRRALAAVTWPGRLEQVHTAPAILLDAAHNRHGAAALASYLRTHFDRKKKILVFGVMKDKDFTSMLNELTPVVDEVLLTRPETERAAEPRQLLPLVCNAVATESVEQALRAVRKKAAPDDVVIVTGSFYTIGEARTLIEKIF